MKICPFSAKLLQEDRQTDEANGRFSQFRELDSNCYLPAHILRQKRDISNTNIYWKRI